MKNFKNGVEETKVEVVNAKPLNGLKTAMIAVVCVLFVVFGILYSNNGNNVVGEDNHDLKTVSEKPIFTTVSTTPITTTTRCTTNTTVVSTNVTTTSETTVITTAEPENIIVYEPRLVFEEPVVEEPVTEQPPIIDEPVTEEPVVEEPVTKESVTEEPVEDSQPIESEERSMTYLGNLKITGYVATGNPTASGCYPYVGGVAMSRGYDLPWGTTIYIDGLGYYTLNDCGCGYGVVDVFCNSVSECYDITSWRDVYIVN